ncbi:MAG: hypothetical protein EON60_12080 [Alphaproteobacteria bacterium]|nr:MAG: hypothetical protein EON60_12080 [Alphaproteobacteria bacterium]
MSINDNDLKNIAAEAATNKVQVMDLLRRRYSHMSQNELDWAAMRMQRVVSENTGDAPKQVAAVHLTQVTPERMRAHA